MEGTKGNWERAFSGIPPCSAVLHIGDTIMADLREQLQSALGDAYRIERELGGGGMSRVFLATETGLDRQVVIKVLPQDLAQLLNPERFEREIQIAARLQHPHVVALLSAGQAGGVRYYVMPWIEGESLRARLSREHELPFPDAVRILRDAADGLAYAHARGLVHRDIKPENILLLHWIDNWIVNDAWLDASLLFSPISGLGRAELLAGQGNAQEALPDLRVWLLQFDDPVPPLAAIRDRALRTRAKLEGRKE